MINHHPTRNQFNATLGTQEAHASYRIESGRFIVSHIQVPPAFRGQGIARALGLAAFAFARQHKLPIVAECSYAARLLEQHPEFQ